ncbi:unnamed protein product [Heligmosomoides polygyrus]|uniref:Uncharacterized protein n=1 Tax=Heligmosomoides polygyrus TaxID=6339 RepID=A0A183FS11_HELPZ|nr:unnamed protein product [Heligmosomoides polygyrus]
MYGNDQLAFDNIKRQPFICHHISVELARTDDRFHGTEDNNAVGENTQTHSSLENSRTTTLYKLKPPLQKHHRHHRLSQT